MNGHALPAIVIEPRRSLFSLGLRELWEYRELLYFLAWRDMRARYAQSMIGIGWAVLQPLLTMLVFTVIFSYWAKMPSDGFPYPVFAYTALLPWTYFAKSVERSGVSVVSESGLIQKVYFPRLIIPIAATIGGLVDFGIAFVLLLGMMVWYGILPTWGVLILPVFVLLTVATALSVSLWLSALYVKYRDVGSTIPLLIQIWMFASPVVYSVSMVPEHWRLLYGLNPMVGVIEGFRWALLGKSSPDYEVLIMSAAVIAVLFWGGLIFFKRMEQSFADII
jgi:lipopolysaccharide transport system permease protein